MQIPFVCISKHLSRESALVVLVYPDGRWWNMYGFKRTRAESCFGLTANKKRAALIITDASLLNKRQVKEADSSSTWARESLAFFCSYNDTKSS